VGYLQNINRLSAADNIGGLIEIQVARKAEVASIPAPVDGVVYGDIEMVGAAGFVTWQPSAINFGSDSAGKQSREGTSKGNIIRLLFPKDRATLRAMFEQATED
jgi:hypothetical protein